MRNDPAAKEQDFIAELSVETGRDLAAWMSEIDGAGLDDRNATIDWLKQRHIYFRRASRAMWLERIHHNGGRPIFEGAPPDVVIPLQAGPSRAKVPDSSVATIPAVEPTSSAPCPASPSPEMPHLRAASLADIEAIVARGKAFRPLANYLLGELRKAVPGLVVGIEQDVLLLAAPATFGAIEVRAKEIRLGLALGHVQDARFAPGRIAGTPSSIASIASLTDVRTIDAALMALARAAAERSA